MLAFAIVLSVLPSLGLHLFHEAIDAAAFRSFGAKGISAALTAVASVPPATSTGWVTGFLLLEDRDDGPLLAIDVTPIGKLGFIIYRVLVTALVTAAITAAAAWRPSSKSIARRRSPWLRQSGHRRGAAPGPGAQQGRGPRPHQAYQHHGRGAAARTASLARDLPPGWCQATGWGK